MFKTIKKAERLFNRFFLVVIILHCIMAPLAQAGEKVRIAVVMSASITPYESALHGFYGKLGKMEIEYEATEFFLDKDSGGSNLVSRIKALAPHMIHSIGTKATRQLKGAFRDTPIIFSMVLNPAASGLVDDMKRPGGNITGAAMDIPLNLQFQYMKHLLPKVSRIGVIYSAEETGSVVADAEKAAKALGIELVKESVRSPSDVPRAVKNLVGRVDVLWSVADSKVFTRETIREILLVTLRETLPFMGLSPAFVRAGALIAMETDPEEIGREAAAIAGQVLSNRPAGEVPVAVSDRVKVVMNKNTMDLIGVELSKEIYAEVEVITP